MNKDKPKVNTDKGIGFFCTALALLIAAAKLFGYVSTSWWVIVGVAVLPYAVLGVVIIVVLILYFIAFLLSELFGGD